MTTLDQIIQKLKAARESKGLSAEQICDRTKIPLHHLEGLEEGRFDDLPEPIYVAGFIKLYAAQLGLNGQLLANEYREWVDSENPHTQVGGKKNRIKSAPDVPIIVSDDYFQKNKIETSPPTFKTIYFNLIMIVLVLGLVSYLGMTQFNNYSNQLENNNAYTTQTANPKGSATGSPETQSNSTTSDTTTGGSSNLPSRNQLMLTANKHVWIEVKSAATGDNLYIGFLEPGSNKTFDAPEQGLRIRATDGADVSVNYQGKTTVLGIAGQETEKVFAPGAVAGLPASAGGSSTAASTTTPAATNLSSTTTTSSTASVGAGSAINSSPINASGIKPLTVSTTSASSIPAAAPRRHHYVDSGLRSSPTSDGQSYKYGEGRLDSE